VIVVKAGIENSGTELRRIISSLSALQPCMCLDLRHAFVTINLSGVVLLTPRPAPNLMEQGVHFADHSPPTSAEVKKMWIYTSTPPYVFMA
jgi:hypothetical protein